MKTIGVELSCTKRFLKPKTPPALAYVGRHRTKPPLALQMHVLEAGAPTPRVAEGHTPLLLPLALTWKNEAGWSATHFPLLIAGGLQSLHLIKQDHFQRRQHGCPGLLAERQATQPRNTERVGPPTLDRGTCRRSGAGKPPGKTTALCVLQEGCTQHRLLVQGIKRNAGLL